MTLPLPCLHANHANKQFNEQPNNLANAHFHVRSVVCYILFDYDSQWMKPMDALQWKPCICFWRRTFMLIHSFRRNCKTNLSLQSSRPNKLYNYLAQICKTATYSNKFIFYIYTFALVLIASRVICGPLWQRAFARLGSPRSPKAGCSIEQLRLTVKIRWSYSVHLFHRLLHMLVSLTLVCSPNM